MLVCAGPIISFEGGALLPYTANGAHCSLRGELLAIGDAGMAGNIQNSELGRIKSRPVGVFHSPPLESRHNIEAGGHCLPQLVKSVSSAVYASTRST